MTTQANDQTAASRRRGGRLGVGHAVAGAAIVALAALTGPGSVLASDAAPAATAASRDARVSPGIPRSFPLRTGMPDYAAELGVRGPSKKTRSPEILDCGRRQWKPINYTQRLAVRTSGIETAMERELLTFGKAQRAVRVLKRIRRSVSACTTTKEPGGHTMVVRVHDDTTGWDDLVWTVTPPERGFGDQTALYGWGVQITRVGSALVLTRQEGDWSYGSAPSGARTLTESARAIAPAMCRWTVAGC